MSSIRVKVVAMGQKPREVTLQSGTTVQEIRETDILAIDDINSKDILINSIEVPSNTELKDGDLVVVTNRPEGGI